MTVDTGLGRDQVRAIPKTPAINLGLPLEEMDLEYEQLHEQEDGPEGRDENDIDAMRGTTIPFRRIWTGKSSSTWPDRKIEKELSKSTNLYNISAANRGTVYRYFERQLDKQMLEKVRELYKQYQMIVNETRVKKVSNSGQP